MFNIFTEKPSGFLELKRISNSHQVIIKSMQNDLAFSTSRLNNMLTLTSTSLRMCIEDESKLADKLEDSCFPCQISEDYLLDKILLVNLALSVETDVKKSIELCKLLNELNSTDFDKHHINISGGQLYVQVTMSTIFIVDAFVSNQSLNEDDDNQINKLLIKPINDFINVTRNNIVDIFYSPIISQTFNSEEIKGAELISFEMYVEQYIFGGQGRNYH